MTQKERMVGNENQLLKARRIRFCGGYADGVEAVELHNSSGLYTTCVIDHGLNLYDFSYRGVNFAFQTKPGLVSNAYYNGGANEFSYYWPGGVFYTCGLTSNGAPATENGIRYAEHGRLGMMPGEEVCVRRGGKGVVLTGTVRESALCGPDLRLHRTIRFPEEGRRLVITDLVENHEPADTEMMLLYHCNFGYPLLAPGARAVFGPDSGCVFRASGEQAPEDCCEVTEPRDDKEESVFLRQQIPDKRGYACAALLNEELGLGCYVEYSADTLPYLLHWKNMCSHDYCVALEPSNSLSLGRAEERRRGTLPVLEGYGQRRFQVILGVLDGREEMQRFEEKLRCGEIPSPDEEDVSL